MMISPSRVSSGARAAWWSSWLLGALALASIFLPAAARADEPALVPALVTVRVVDGKPYRSIAAGSYREGALDYAITLFVEELSARREYPALTERCGGSTVEKLTRCNGDRVANFVVWGDFAKLAVLHFGKRVDGKQLKAAFTDGLRALLTDKAPPELRERALSLLALLEHDLAAGEELTLRGSPSGKIEIGLGARVLAAPTDPRLARALWEIWLGQRPSMDAFGHSLPRSIVVLSQ